MRRGDSHFISKAILIPIALFLGLIGVILMLYGGIKLWNLSGEDVDRAGLTTQLAQYTDCDYRARAMGNATTGGAAGTKPGAKDHTVLQQAQGGQRTEQFHEAIRGWCEAQQRPYLYFQIATALMVLISMMLAICVGWKTSRGFLTWFNIHNAITLALLFVSIYVMLEAIKPLYSLRDCSGMDQASVQHLAQLGVVCYNAGGEPQSRSRIPDYVYSNILACFWVGVAFNIIAVFLLTLLSSLAWWYKGRYGAGAPATGGRASEPYYYSEEERRRAAAPTV
jgi:hypothetical protein